MSDTRIDFGMASCAMHQCRFVAAVQPKWQAFSEKIISHFASNLKKWDEEPPQLPMYLYAPKSSLNTLIGKAYIYLCDARHHFAIYYSQQKPEISEKYGQFGTNYYISDTIHFKDPSAREGEIYKAFDSLLRNVPSPNYKSYVNQKGANEIVIQFEGENKLQMEFHVSRPIHATSLLEVDHINKVIVRHPRMPIEAEARELYFAENFAKAQVYFQACLDWTPEQPFRALLTHFAKLSFFFAIFEPLRSGNAAIVEWMVRGLAIAKGIKLGCFNWRVLGWDLKAFVSHDSDHYANWYVQHVFVNFEAAFAHAIASNNLPLLNCLLKHDVNTEENHEIALQIAIDSNHQIAHELIQQAAAQRQRRTYTR